MFNELRHYVEQTSSHIAMSIVQENNCDACIVVAVSKKGEKAIYSLNGCNVTQTVHF